MSTVIAELHKKKIAVILFDNR